MEAPARIIAATLTLAALIPSVVDAETIRRPTAILEHADPTLERARRVQVPPTGPVPAVRVPPPAPIPGDCDSWRAVFVARGATPVEVGFFFDGGIVWRETRCGLDTLNERTGDSGIVQINPVHARAGWFGGRYYTDGGWLRELHDLTPRVDTDSPRWVDAALTLYRVCDRGPWQPPYTCTNRRYP